jgi:hypothetical protein
MLLNDYPWVKNMPWLEHIGTHRTLTHAWWLGLAVIAQSWRFPFAAATTALRRGGRHHRVRMTAVSRAWLLEHEAESVKHKEAP